MWSKPSTYHLQLKALRVEAARAFAGRPPRDEPLVLLVRVFAIPQAGDLDNFTSGICDGLMAANPRANVDPLLWQSVSEAAHPTRPIAFTDDKHVWRLDVERHPPGPTGPYYEIELRWGDPPILEDAKETDSPGAHLH